MELSDEYCVPQPPQPPPPYLPPSTMGYSSAMPLALSSNTSPSTPVTETVIGSAHPHDQDINVLKSISMSNNLPKLSNTSNIHMERPQSLLSSTSLPSSSAFYSAGSPKFHSVSSSCLSSPRCVSCCRAGFYLSVAVGGRRNYLFQEDNITPAGSPDSPITRAIKEERLKAESDAAAEAEAEESKSKISEAEPKSASVKVVPTTPTVSQPHTARSAASSCASASEDSLEEEGMDEPTSPLSASSNSSLSSTDAHNTDEMELTSSPQSSLQSLPSQTQTQEMSPSLLSQSSAAVSNPLTLSPSTTREKRRKKMRVDSTGSGGSSSPEESEEESEAQSPLVQQRREKTLLALRAAAQERDRMHDGLASPSSARLADNFFIEAQNGERIKIQSYSGMPLHVAGGYGQDAFYVAADESIHSETNEPVLLLSLGVADGVGGWRSTGVDSGKMAQAMMKNCLHMVHDRMKNSSQYVANTYAPSTTNCQDDILYSPADMMARAYYDIQLRRSVDAGSTTACVVHLLPNCLYESLMNRRKQQQLTQEPGMVPREAELHVHQMKDENQMDSTPTKPANGAAPPALATASTAVDVGASVAASSSAHHTHSSNGCTMLCANLGDSGFTVYRNSSVVVQCEYQRDETGVVKQLAMIPEAIAKTPEAFEYCQDSPTEASISNHRVSVNDIIILASDGLWDNLCEPLVSFSHPFAGLLRVKANLDVNAVSRTRRMQKVIRKLIKSAMKDEELANRKHFNEKSHVGESIAECKEAEEESDEDEDDNASDEAIHQREFQAFSCGKEVDVRRICGALVKHAADYMKSFEGKPDDLTVMVAQLRRQTPQSCSCNCHQMK